jgi:hypothetical protein
MQRKRLFFLNSFTIKQGILDTQKVTTCILGLFGIQLVGFAEDGTVIVSNFYVLLLCCA